MGASKFGQGNLSQLGPNQQPVQTVGTTPVVFYLPEISDLDVISFHLVVESGGVQGSWLIEGSNDYNEVAWNGLPANAGHWVTITPATLPAEFFPAVVAVTAAYPAASGNQFVRSGVKIGFRAMRFTFTPTSSTGLVSVYAVGKASN